MSAAFEEQVADMRHILVDIGAELRNIRGVIEGKTNSIKPNEDVTTLNSSLVPVVVENNASLSDVVKLNVGGKRHEIKWSALDKFPNSRLGRLRNCVFMRGN